MPEFWATLATLSPTSEGDVETQLLLPLLFALGYAPEEIGSKVAVRFYQGRRGRPHEADIVAYSSPVHNRDTSLITIEAKAPSESLVGVQAQAESYAVWLRTPLYVLSNGKVLQVWQYQPSLESTLCFEAEVRDLASHRGTLEGLLAKPSASAWAAKLARNPIGITKTNTLGYLMATLDELERRTTASPLDRDIIDELQGVRVAPESILDAYPKGALIAGPGGAGKSTAIAQIAIALIVRSNRSSVPGEVPVPLYVHAPEASALNQSCEQYVHARLAARCPPLTGLPAFRDWLAQVDCCLLVDGLERSPIDRVIAEINQLRSQFPRLRAIVASRSASIAQALCLPLLRLPHLSYEEIRAFIASRLQVSDADSAMLLHAFPEALVRQCRSPYVLDRAIAYYKANGHLPRSGAVAIQEALLNSAGTDDLAARAIVERALCALAWACADGPVSLSRAAAALPNGDATPLEVLRRNGVLRILGGSIEFSEDVAVDYMLAFDISESTATSAALEVALDRASSRGVDGDLGLFLAERLTSSELQATLWRWLIRRSLTRYLEAISARADLSQRSLAADGPEWFLSELYLGLVQVLSAHFPSQFSAVFGPIKRGEAPALYGYFDVSRPSLVYAPCSIQDDRPGRVYVLREPPWDFPVVRGVDLALSGLRADSPRVIAASHVRKELELRLKNLAICDGPEWTKERILGWIRVLNRFVKRKPLEGRKLERVLQFSSKHLGVGDVHTEQLLQDLARGVDAGWPPADEWYPDYDAWRSSSLVVADEDIAKQVEQQYRRMIVLYREAVGNVFAACSGELYHYPIWPLRYVLRLLRVASDVAERVFIYEEWVPVASWSEATVTCQWIASRDEIPERGLSACEAKKASLRRHGRRDTFFAWGGGYPFAGPDVRFRTVALEHAGEFLAADLKHLFRLLRSTDEHPTSGRGALQTVNGVPAISFEIRRR